LGAARREEVVGVLLTHVSGAKVGWNYWSTREEAEADAKHQASERGRKLSLGYDFGYLWPGTLEESVLKADLTKYGSRDENAEVVAREGETVFVVVTV
jgi:hypothetical protein